MAFGSTYAWEKQLTDDDWRQRAAQLMSPTSIGYLAMAENKARGLVVGRLDDDEPAKAYLFSMWVAPEARKRGVGNQLVSAVLDWAETQNRAALYLMVTSSNMGAIAFYRRLGFTFTGYTEPYPHDSALMEYEMVRSLQKFSELGR
jgi:ribosomal protein S18 acetylase RimI-like enzyme